MSNSIAYELEKARELKKNDVNSYEWKGPKKYINGEVQQESIKLMDATKEQLQQFYNHCKSMLYSTNKDDPGRYTLIKIIEDQNHRCNAELYIRSLRARNYKQHIFYQDLKNYLDSVKNEVPQSKWSTTPISKVVQVAPDFENIPISIVLDAALSTLGRFKRKHITTNFITKMGIWFAKGEEKEYLYDDSGKLPINPATGEPMDKLDIVKRNLDIKDSVELYRNSKTGLSYKEFRSVYRLHDMLYSEMSSDQLTVLRDKILFRLELEVRKHARLWEEKIEQINKVCETRGIKLTT